MDKVSSRDDAPAGIEISISLPRLTNPDLPIGTVILPVVDLTILSIGATGAEGLLGLVVCTAVQ